MPIFLLVFRNSPAPNSSVLADIELQFVSGEQDPVKHLRAIVSRGHISGMMVYPDYFLVLGGKIDLNWNMNILFTIFQLITTVFKQTELL